MKRPFTLEVFELDVVDVADRPLARRFTTELRDIVDEYARVMMSSSRAPEMLDHEVMSGCNRTMPRCLAILARSVHAERIIFGDVAGTAATVKLYVVATDTTLVWSTDKLPTDAGGLAAVAHDAIESLFSRAP